MHKKAIIIRVVDGLAFSMVTVFGEFSLILSKSAEFSFLAVFWTMIDLVSGS